MIKTELYHVATDITESHDVAAKHPELVAHLEKLMREHRTPSDEFPFPTLDLESAK